MQRLALLTLVFGAAAISAAQHGRRWVWPSSDAERFHSFSSLPLGGSPFGRSLGVVPSRRHLPLGAGSLSTLQNRLVTSGGGGRRCPLIAAAACPPRHVLLPGVDVASLQPCGNDASCPPATRCCYHPCLTLSLCLTPAANVAPSLA